MSHVAVQLIYTPVQRVVSRSNDVIYDECRDNRPAMGDVLVRGFERVGETYNPAIWLSIEVKCLIGLALHCFIARLYVCKCVCE